MQLNLTAKRFAVPSKVNAVFSRGLPRVFSMTNPRKKGTYYELDNPLVAAAEPQYGSAEVYYASTAAATPSGNGVASNEITFEENRVRTMQYMKQFIADDLQKLATGQENDWSMYTEDIYFTDPITRFESKQLYILNINMLKTLFKPDFVIHSVEITGYDVITTRWTMTLKLDMVPTFVLGAKSPAFDITGTTKYKVDVVNKKITEHVDTWDSVKNQDFFSIEGAADMIRAIIVASTQLTPNIPSPKYTVLLRTADYEIREYEEFVAAEAPMVSTSPLPFPLPFPLDSLPNVFSGPNSGAGFNQLAGYIFGGNAAKQKYDMTTPVLSRTNGDNKGVMSFPIDGVRDASVLPTPNDPAVQAKNIPKAIVAAYRFGGFPMDNEVRAAVDALRNALARDRLTFDGGYELARYNDPATLPFLRRNEIIIRLENFEMPKV